MFLQHDLFGTFLVKAEFDAFFPELVCFVKQTFGVETKKPVIHRPWVNDVVI